MAKKKRTKGQTMIYKTLRNKLGLKYEKSTALFEPKVYNWTLYKYDP